MIFVFEELACAAVTVWGSSVQPRVASVRTWTVMRYFLIDASWRRYRGKRRSLEWNFVDNNLKLCKEDVDALVGEDGNGGWKAEPTRNPVDC